MRKLILASSIVIAALAAPGAFAQNFTASSDRFGYSPDSTIIQYATEQDAENGTNGTLYNFPQRDAYVYAVNNEPSVYTNTFTVGTNWWIDANDDGQNNGSGNPNNTDTGFVQLYNDPSYTKGEWTVSSWSGSYSPDGQTFVLDASGENATYQNSVSRLWSPGNEGLGGLGTAGTWVQYDLHLQVSGLNAVFNSDLGQYVNTTNGTDYSGYFQGLFYNPEVNLYYTVDLQFNDVSWAGQNGLLDGDEDQDQFIGDISPTPEPASFGALGLGVFGLLARRRKAPVR